MKKYIFILCAFTTSIATAQGVRPDLFVKETILRNKNLAAYSQENGALRGFKVDSLLAQSFGIYALLVASVSETGNPEGLRNKIVTDFKGRAYAIDFYGNAKILIDTLAYATNAALADSNAASRTYIDIKTSQTLNAAVRTANSYTDTVLLNNSNKANQAALIDTARSIRQDVANNINHLDSSRGSSSFAKTVVINPVKSAQFRNDQASILRLSEKEILIAYSQYFNSTEDGTNISIATSKSTDNGLTFPASTRIDTNIYVPSLYQKGNKIGCIYLKKSGTLLNQVWEMESADGGATWINNRMIVGTTTSYYSPTSNVIYRKGGKLYYSNCQYVSGTYESSPTSYYTGSYLESADNGANWTQNSYTFVPPAGTTVNESYFWGKGDSTAYSWRSYSGAIYTTSTKDFTTWSAPYRHLESGNSASIIFATNKKHYAIFNRVENGVFNGLAARINLDLAVSLDTGRTFKTIATLASSKENNRYHIEPSVLIDSNKVLVTYSSSLSISPNLYELIKKELTFSELEILEMSVNTSPLNSTFSQSFGFGTGGKVGVGTANPLVKFVVSNNGAQGLEIDPASSQIEIASYNRLNRAYFPTRFSASSFKYSIAGSSSVLTIASNGNIGIKDETPSAPLTITSTLGGVLFPRLTQTQVTAVVSPIGGTVLFNTTTSKLQVFTGSAWVDLH